MNFAKCFISFSCLSFSKILQIIFIFSSFPSLAMLCTPRRLNVKAPFTLYRIAIVAPRFPYRIGGPVYIMPQLSGTKRSSNRSENHFAS